MKETLTSVIALKCIKRKKV